MDVDIKRYYNYNKITLFQNFYGGVMYNMIFKVFSEEFKLLLIRYEKYIVPGIILLLYKYFWYVTVFMDVFIKRVFVLSIFISIFIKGSTARGKLFGASKQISEYYYWVAYD